MAEEIEIKVKVDAHDAVRDRLLACGAAPQGRVLETNRIFDNAERSLLASGCGLRIRECHDDRGQLVRGVLTYKGAKSSGPIKRRQEIECEVDDPAAAAALLGALGFVESLRFEKRRESWDLRHCHIELDEVPYLGRFVEIEGPEEALIRKLQHELGLGSAPLISESYIGLLVNHCRDHQLSADAIHF